MRSASFSTVSARGNRAIQYAAGYRLKHCCLWDTGSPGPTFAKDFGEATSSRARRSFSEGGEPGDDLAEATMTASCATRTPPHA
jgi:hypothetical protein